jgi:hypothetical protein
MTFFDDTDTARDARSILYGNCRAPPFTARFAPATMLSA